MKDLGFLDKPTVRDMIKFLNSLDQSLPIRMNDADTGWNISIIHFEMYYGRVRMSGIYEEMADEPEIQSDP